MSKFDDFYDKMIHEAAKSKARALHRQASGYQEGEILDLEVKDFKDNLDSVPVYPQMVKDLQRKSVTDYLGFLVRYAIVIVLSIFFVVMFFTVKRAMFKAMFLLGSIYVIGICTMGDVVISYPFSNIKWYKEGIDGCYLAVVTYKHRLSNNEKNTIVLNDKFSIMPSIVSEYSEIDEGEAIIIVTRGDDFHLISTEEFLGIEADKQSFKDFLQASFK